MSQQKDPLGNYQPARLPTEGLITLTGDQVHEFIERWEEAHQQALPPKMLELDPTENARQFYYPDVEAAVLPEDTEWLSLAKGYIPQAVREYVHFLETGETREWCKCPWIIHPDDANTPEGVCVHCGEEQETNFHDVGSIIDSDAVAKGFHRFQGRRIRRDHNNQHPECPVHTKEGFILGFFEHLFREQDEATHTSGT